MELIFNNGNVELDQHISYDEKRLGKIRLVRDGDTEGIWALFSEEGKKKYDDDNYGDTDVVVLCNQSLAGVPWGSYVKIEYRGEDRPICICEDVFGDDPTFTMADWAAASACDNVLKNLQEGNYNLDTPGVRDYILSLLKVAPESDVTAALKALLEQ